MRPSASLSLVALLASAMPFATAQVKPNNLAATSTSGALSALKYTKVGSTGSYDQVTNIIPGTFPTCDANPFCVTQPKQISGECPRSLSIVARSQLTLARAGLSPQATSRRSTTR